jgi:hypothetical protein
MKKNLILFIALILGLNLFSYAQSTENNGGDAYVIITNSGENARKEIRINWHTNIEHKESFCIYTERSDTAWQSSTTVKAKQEFCTTFDSIYSKKASGEDFYEDARFWRCSVALENLEPDMEYMYRVGTTDMSEIHYFKTASESGEWSCGIISDIHTYPPLPQRLKSAMNMLKTLENVNGKNFDFILHAGDLCAWGGSHSFWKELYAEPYFCKYMWAGVNGNHDDMARDYAKQTNQYFRHVNNNPLNGYEGEEGVCYYFIYDNALFIMLNNENMRDDKGFDAAQEWVKKVIETNTAKYIIVVEHYQWFWGESGKAFQYSRWKELFDKYGVDLAIGGNEHIYARTNAIYQNRETDGSIGTVYIQTPSSDNGRGRELKEWTDNTDLMKYRWTEGANTVGAIIMHADNDNLHLTLYDRNGNEIDKALVKAKR